MARCRCHDYLQRPQRKGADHEASPAYHLHRIQNDSHGCLSLGTGACAIACPSCPTLCPTRALSPGAGLPGIGILSDIARKNSWQVAEHAREARPDGMQRLLSQAVWDTDGVRDAPLAPTRLSSWVGSRPSWSSMKPASPNGGRSRLGWACSSVAQRGKWRTARWASFSRM